MNMIISDYDFVLAGQVFFRDDWSGRYYRLDEPSGFYTRAARERGLVKKRISRACYEERLTECKAKIAEQTKEKTA
jgi:hypothetical protein